ncbi:MAG: hypothetical protein ACI39R_00075 [Lachnospiraceae bacterium]
MKAKKKLRSLLSLLLCLVMVMGMLPTTVLAWEVESECEFCGGFIADDWICDCGEGDHCSEFSDRSDCYLANHCIECGKGVGSEFICSDCGMCVDCGGECDLGIDACGYCLRCHLEYGEACPECGKCVIDDPEEICDYCGQCYECGGMCSEGRDHLCLECHISEGDNLACEGCGLCFLDNEDEMCGGCGLCYECGGGECSEGREHACLECHLMIGLEFACENCGRCYSPGDGSDIDESLFCPECKICWDCVDECTNCDMCIFCGIEDEKHCICGNCFTDYPQCPDCGLCSECLDWCENCEKHWICAVEDGNHCLNCEEACIHDEALCPECGACEDCSSNWCSACEMCLECHDPDDICMECEEVCLFDDSADCHHCSSCVDDYLCGGCGECMICEDLEWCENCGMCIECAINEELHCPETGCENCYEEFAQCEAGNNHCVEHCVICENCEECFYENESEICDECGLCLDCCEELKKAAGCTCEDAPCVFSGEAWKNHWNSAHGGTHTHVYPDGYQKDEDGHWKTCIICDETVSNDHQYSDWSYLTTREPYYAIRKCKDCGYTERCSHTEWGDWQGVPCQTIVWTSTADKTQHEYTCEICGNHIYHSHNLTADAENSAIHVCTDCGLEQEHTFGEWTLKIITDPFIGRIYTSSSTCTGCGEKMTCTHLHGAIDDWERIDDTTHGFTCEKCGVTFVLPHQTDDTGLHCDENGHWNTCKICDDKIMVKEHVGVRVHKLTPTATTDGYTGDLVCAVCGYLMEKGTGITATGYDHEHQFSTEWTDASSMHWHDCSIEGCSAKSEIENHVFGDWELVIPATEEEDGLKQHTCLTCGHISQTSIPAGHVHSYEDIWKYDADNHWYLCSCGDKGELSPHTFKWVVDKEATTTEKGSKHEECDVCGYKNEAVEIPVIVNSDDPTEPSDPTNPSDPATPSDPTNPDDTNKDTDTPSSPETGDNSMICLWVALLFVSGTGVVETTIYSRKKKHSAK